MERPAFWRLFLKTVVSVQGVLLAAAGLVISLFFTTTWTAPGKWFVLLLVVAVFCVAVPAGMLFHVWPLLMNTLPKVRFAGQRTIGGHERLILLLEPSSLFAYDAIVSLYRRENDIETAVAYGRVLSIQSNGLIQVLLRLA